MPRKNGNGSEPQDARALNRLGTDALKKWRKGLPVGTSQAQVMADAARLGQLGTKIAVLRLLAILRNPASSNADQIAAARIIMGAFGFPQRADVNFAGVVAAGTPQDFQAAIDQAVATFMANRESFRVEAVDVTPKPEFHENGESRNGT